MVSNIIYVQKDFHQLKSIQYKSFWIGVKSGLENGALVAWSLHQVVKMKYFMVLKCIWCVYFVWYTTVVVKSFVM